MGTVFVAQESILILTFKNNDLAGSKESSLAPRDGFEPPAKRLTAACSTAELPGTTSDVSSRYIAMQLLRHKPFLKINYFVWRPGPESNRRKRICSPLHNHSATGPYSKKLLNLHVIPI